MPTGHLTHRLSEHALQTTGDVETYASTSPTSCNVLLDCHSEVWTRYPVQPLIHHGSESITNAQERRSINFISANHNSRYRDYFNILIRDLQRHSHKPTNGRLAQIEITSSSSFESSFADQRITVSNAGDWLATLLCLIPIRIALTGSCSGSAHAGF